MNPTIEINESVDVAVLYKKHGDISTLAQPFKMRWKDREITFVQLGLRHPTAKSKRMIHVFDVSDGSDDYRLEFDAERLTWQLIAIVPGARS